MPKSVATPTTTQSFGALLKSARDIMRKDKGLNGDDRRDVIASSSARTTRSFNSFRARRRSSASAA
jgi:hypothetical protein